MSALSWAVAPGLIVAFGWAILHLLRVRITALGLVAAPAVGFVTGAAGLNLVSTLVGVLGGPIRPWPVTGPLVLGTILAAVVAARRSPGTPAEPRAWSAEAAPLMTAALCVPVVIVATVQRITSNDEYAIWALKGRAFFAAGRIDPFMFAGEPMLAYSSRDYPLLLPSLQVWADGWHGSTSDPLAITLVALLTTSALVVASAALGRVAGVTAAVLASTAVLVLSDLARQATKFMADAPLTACAVALIAVVLLSQSPDVNASIRRERVVVATALAAACGGLKNEGLAFALAVLVAAAIVDRRAWTVQLLPLAGVMGAFAPWAIWCRLHGVQSNFINSANVGSSGIDDLERIPGLLAAVAEHWPGPWMLIPVAASAWTISVVLDRSRVALVLAVSAALSMAALLVTYVVAPTNDADFLASNMPRVLLFPAALVNVSIPVLAALLIRGRTARHAAPERVSRGAGPPASTGR